MSVKSKIQSLIDSANAKTGETDATLTDAVQTLVDGYGQGADPVINPLSVTENGTYTAPSGVDGYSPVTVNVSGGGSLPSSISKIDGGSFTLAADTNAQNYNISHNLGETPKGFFIWSDLGYGEAESTIMLSSIGFSVNNYSATITGFYGGSRKLTTGAMNAISAGVVASTWLTTTTFKVNTAITLKAGVTYKWLAWA